MDSWTALALFISLLGLALTSLLNKGKRKGKLPPGPPSMPILGSLIFLTEGMAGLARACRALHARYGSLVTLYAGPRAFVLITDGELAHKLFVQEHSVAFADRPPVDKIVKLSSANQHSINTAPHGPLWRVLRRNIVSEVVHVSRVKVHSEGREWAVWQLVNDLRTQAAASGSGVVTPLSSFDFSFFCLLSFICFGEKLDETIIRTIQQNVWEFHSMVNEDLEPFKFLSKLANFVLRKKWNKMLELHRRINGIFHPLIQAVSPRDRNNISRDNQNSTYVDSLLNLRLPHEGDRNLTQDQLVALCLELYVGGIDTTTVALQWIMARLVKHPNIQEKLLKDIEGVVGAKAEWVTEEDAQKLPYLNAIIKESLRLHPPAHFVMPHCVSKEVQVNEYVIPKGTTVSVAIGVINRDEKLWEDPMNFKPERFMSKGEGVDLAKGNEIKMMSFGVGRRSCPAAGLAILHLEYFVANLIWKFEWKAVKGEEVDMTEETAFTTSMKNPLRVHLLPRKM